MIRNRKIISIRVSGEWGRIGFNSVRGDGRNYKGPEERKNRNAKEGTNYDLSPLLLFEPVSKLMEGIDILGNDPLKVPLLFESGAEAMGKGRPGIFYQIDKIARKLVKEPRIAGKPGNVEDFFRVISPHNIQPLGTPKIGNSSCRRNPRPGQDHQCPREFDKPRALGGFKVAAIIHGNCPACRCPIPCLWFPRSIRRVFDKVFQRPPLPLGSTLPRVRTGVKW